MGHVRFIDEIYSAPQFYQAGAKASWAWTSSVLYCSSYELFDCMFPESCARIVSEPGQAKRTTAKLMAAGLWRRVDGGRILVVGRGEIFDFGSTRKPFQRGQRERIIERDGLVCGLCGDPVEERDVHIDHVRPVLIGGRNDDDNLRVTHSECNLRRPRRPQEFEQ